MNYKTYQKDHKVGLKPYRTMIYVSYRLRLFKHWVNSNKRANYSWTNEVIKQGKIINQGIMHKV